jgi:hypothetical protein
MNRRKFIKTAGLATAGAVAAPYLLPTGRLFAATGSRAANHVVFVLFAGGVRQQESVLQRYLDDSQGLTGIEGNVMYNLLNGDAPTQKIVYGTDPAVGPSGSVPIPKLLSGSQTVQNMGTYFPELHATSAGHYSGLNTLVTGNTAYTQGLRQKPVYPTIFEYARRHAGLKATDTWFVGNGIGNSIPLLNYSTHPDYGSQYGGNFLAPNITFGSQGIEHISNAKIYHPDEELGPMYQMKYFLDNSFASGGASLLDYGIQNTEEEREEIREFIKQMFVKQANGQVARPPVSDNGDMNNIGWALEVIKWFQPTVTVINMSAVDGCHSNFTGYLRSLHRADHGTAWLWEQIQQIPGMSGDTVMIVAPECGRNAFHNPILDENDWYAFDHSDDNTARIFAMMMGPGIPAGEVRGDAVSETKVGESVDCVPTIAEVLGFKTDVYNAGLLAAQSRSLFEYL